MKRRVLWLPLTVLIMLCVLALWMQRDRQQYALNRQLIEVLERDNTKAALALVNAGADPNTLQEELPAPTFRSLLNRLLHHSPPPVNESASAFLIACGAPIPYEGQDTAGHIIPENVRLVQAMLAHDADIQALWGKTTPLHVAVRDNRLQTVELLLQRGADQNAQDEDGRTPLIDAASSKMAATTHLLLTHGANPNAQDQKGRSALLHVVRYDGPASIVADLLAHGADPNLPANNRGTPLGFARIHRRADLVHLLQQHGAK